MSKTLKNVFYVSVGVFIAQTIGSFRSFFLAKVLVPSDYGIWSGLQVIISLAPIACLGTVEALLKQVPYYRGKKDLASLKAVENAVFATILLAALLIAVVFILAPRFLPFHFIQDNLLVVRITAATAAISFFTSYYYFRCTAYEDFKIVGAFDAWRSVSAFICIVLFGWLWGLPGAAVGLLTSEVLNWIVVAHVSGKLHGDVQPAFRQTRMCDSIRVGFPITVIWWVYAIHMSVGRVTSISCLGNTAAGFYGVGSSLAMLFAIVPNMIGRVFYPRVNAQIGARADVREIKKSVVVPTSAITLILPFAQVVVFYMLPIVYTYFLPKYRQGLAAAQILILGAFFVGLIRNGANYLIAADKQMHLMKYVFISVLVNAGGSYLLATHGYGINGVAVAACFASGLLASLIWLRVFAELGYDRKKRVLLFANFYLPFAAVLLAICAVHIGFLEFQARSLWMTPVQIVITLALCATIVAFSPDIRLRTGELYRKTASILASRLKQPALK